MIIGYILKCMASKENLLTELHRWAKRQDENFTTESFAHLLKRLVRDVPNQISQLMTRLTGLTIEEGGWSEAEIDTQVHTRFGTPDISIATPNMTIYVEVKVEAELAEGQAEGYLSALEEIPESQAEVTQLVLLTKYPAPKTVSASVHRTRWHEIIEELEALQKGELPEVAAYLLEQFVDFLASRGMALPRVCSKISSGVRNYISRAGTGTITMSRLDEAEELQPLSGLLSMMNHVIDSSLCSKKSIRFGAGQGEGMGWLGWNIDSMQYFFYIRVASPEVVVFLAYYAPTDPEKYNESVGRLFQENNQWLWEIELDLNESGFFNLKKSAQVSMLVKFVQNSYTMALAMRT
jgi:hypothetical protein